MSFEDLETTLRIKVDKSDLDALKRSVAEAYADAVKAGMAAGSSGGSGGGGGGRAGTTTSTASGDGGASPGGGGSGGGGGGGGGRGGGPPPGSKTKSTGDDDGGSDSGGGGTRRRVGRDFRGRFAPGEMDYRDHLSGPGLSSTARFFAGGIFSRNPFGAGLSALSTAAGDAYIERAKAQAEMIEHAKAAGASGSSLPTMGFMRYAPAAATALTVAASTAGEMVNAGLDLQAEHSKRFASYASDLAQAHATGAGLGQKPGRSAIANFFQQAAQQQNGALNEDQAMQALRSWNSMGFDPRSRGNHYGGLNALSFTGAGISPEASSSYISQARLGAQNADPSRLIGAAQSAGLGPGVIGNLLQQLAANTRQLVTRGIPVDMDKASAFIERAIGLGRSPEVAANAQANLASQGANMLQQLDEPLKQYGQAKLWLDALQTARANGNGSYMGLRRTVAGTRYSDASSVQGILERGGSEFDIGASEAVGGVYGSSGIGGANRPGQQSIRPLSAQAPEAYGFAGALSDMGASLWGKLQELPAFQAWAARKGGLARGEMEAAEDVNNAAASVQESADRIVGAIGTMLNEMKINANMNADRIINAVQKHD